MTSTTTPGPPPVRRATLGDLDRLIDLWALVYDERAAATDAWSRHARAWFIRVVEDPLTTWLPVLDVGGVPVASAIGMLELGVPNPYCVHGRTVRLTNVITLPRYRRRGYGSLLVDEVVRWARSIDADRVDLSATAAGERIYAAAGFAPTSAPRMKLVLD